MSRPEPLLPAYDFSSAPEPVSLLQGTVKVGLRNGDCSGTADLQLQFRPSPRLLFRNYLHGVAGSPLAFVYKDQAASSFSFNGQAVEGFSGLRRINIETNVVEFDWHSTYEPWISGDMSSRTGTCQPVLDTVFQDKLFLARARGSVGWL